ncbi:Holliday junction branch migration protein RuvA [Spiroplasma endosymbiont of Amphibalanus improvisus]|uniref:Holliday junction branch migration protein RuvA n=1 Tax=Spiroplasma endosymbiont of Amphibalanus improvisus TaxID=3066327 RepID=UPI00313E79BA
MISYLSGRVIKINNKTAIIRTNNVGFEVQVVDSKQELSILQDVNLYIYNVFVDNNSFLFLGFFNLESKMMFSHFLDIPGIGLKKAINILNKYTPFEILNIIRDKQINKLEDIQGLRNNDIHAIVEKLDKLYFKVKYNNVQKSTIECLKKLGFNSKDIYQSMNSLPKSNDLNLYLKSVIQGIKE